MRYRRQHTQTTITCKIPDPIPITKHNKAPFYPPDKPIVNWLKIGVTFLGRLAKDTHTSHSRPNKRSSIVCCISSDLSCGRRRIYRCYPDNESITIPEVLSNYTQVSRKSIIWVHWNSSNWAIGPYVPLYIDTCLFWTPKKMNLIIACLTEQGSDTDGALVWVLLDYKMTKVLVNRIILSTTL